MKNKKLPIKMTSDLFLLGGDYFNMYLVRGRSKSALIELGVSAIAGEVVEQLEHIGIEPDFLILTHPDSDHVTGWNHLHAKFPKAKLILAKGVSSFIKKKKVIDMILREDMFMHQQFCKMGKKPICPPVLFLSEFENYVMVETPISIDLGMLSIKCIPVLGHALGNLIVELEEKKIFFVSDCVGVEHNGENIPFFFRSYSDYLLTIQKIIDSKPKIVAPAHHGPYCNFEAVEAMLRARESTIKMYDMICHSRENDDFLARKIYNKIYNGGLKLFTEDNIMQCARILIYRANKACEKLKLTSHSKKTET